MKENVDYELIPNDEESWDVRILSGDFIETVITYNVVTVDEKEESLKFDFNVKYSPDADVTSETYELQLLAGNILFSVIESGMENEEAK